MGDVAALQYLAIQTPGGCVELWNQARFDAYLRAGISPAGWTVHATPCNGLEALLQGTDLEAPAYSDPEFDVAPWWDPHPAVATRARRFAGFVATEVSGLDNSTDTVDIVNTVDGSAVFVNRRDVPREVTVRGLLVGMDCCSVRYGLEWLKLSLADASCSGVGGEMTYLSCCPPAQADVDFCADSTGECDPDTDPDCIEIDCEDEPVVYDLSASEWWRSLIGVEPSSPVRVTNKFGASCGCGGSEVIEVQFSFTTGNPRPWRVLATAEQEVAFSPINRRPTYRFRKVSKTLVPRTQTRERKELKAVLRGNRWCPVGRWTAGELQQFGGEGYLTITEAVASTAAETTAVEDNCSGTGNPKRPHYIRVVFDQVTGGGQLYFETVRWVNNSWNAADPLSSVPCDTPIEVVELVRLRMLPTGPEGALELSTEVSANSDGEDCCYIALQWTAPMTGFWFTAAGPNTAGDASPWTDWGAEGPPPTKSGWPPAGCKVVVSRNCAPVVEQNVCPDSVDCPIVLAVDGTWAPATGTPAYDVGTFPPEQCRFVVTGQTTVPITETVTDVVYGSCPQGCAPDTDPLADPLDVRRYPPSPPLVAGSRCLPATRIETMMRWADNPSWDTVVPVVEYHSGRAEATGVEILVWANPLGLNPNEPSSRDVFLDCNACGTWSLSRVPAGTTIRVDGRARKVVALIPGGREIPAGQLVETRDNRPLQWPTIDGCGVVAAVRVGANNADLSEAWASLYVAGSGS